MMLFEKAIENFAKNRKKFYNRALKHDIAEFNQAAERMTATGKCKGMSCCDCPITLVQEMYGAPSCVEITPEEKKKLLAMEV